MHTIAFRTAGRPRHTDISTIHDALVLDVVGALHTGNNFYHNNCLPVNFLYCDIRGDLGFAAVENGVGNRIHSLKNFLFGKTGNHPCTVLYAKDQLSPLPIGKGYHRLHIFFTFGWNFTFELHIFGFTGKNLFRSHLGHLLHGNFISLPKQGFHSLAYGFANIKRRYKNIFYIIVEIPKRNNPCSQFSVSRSRSTMLSRHILL